MKKSEAIAHFQNNASALARALGIDQSSIYSWPGDTMPIGRQYQLEVVTRGALKANPRHAFKAAPRKVRA